MPGGDWLQWLNGLLFCGSLITLGVVGWMRLERLSEPRWPARRSCDCRDCRRFGNEPCSDFDGD